MSTSYKPLFRNSVGHTQNFGAEETLSWNFTSLTGNPMELLVGGATYFTFHRDGKFILESDITWNADTGGDIGDQYDHRPDAVNIATTLAVGAASGVGDGSKLQLNTLTLGHGNVDKHIDAEQGLGNTPFLRYNAVNTRWEFSDDGIVATAFSAGFGTTTWDALYAADKTLIIDSTVLTFNQTATSGVAFSVVRNLAAASTDSPIFLVEQQHASDDKPGMAIAQVATAASALDIYEGTQAAGTIRYGFGATGQLTITTNATLADSAIHIIQNDTDQPFVTAEGTSGAGASVSISTDSGATADMLQVTVDGGGGANKRWIPAYTSTTLPAITSWDAIYALDKHLSINAAALEFEQTATTDRGFEVFRNLTAASTDAPIMVIEQQHASDDQPPLAIGQLAGTADALRIYDGSVVSGTMRFQFSPRGRLNIVTNASLASEALRIEQNDDNVAFMEFKGTEAAGSGKNISTDNAPTADMLRVTVDDGGGAALRWIPAYNSSTLPATPTWDAIYAGDKTLDISSTVLTFDQSSTTGVAFIVSRSLAAASTDSPIMKVMQNSSTDDQTALTTTGGIGNVVLAAGVAVAESIATSAGMTNGPNNLMIGHRSTVATHATDAVGSITCSYSAQLDNAAGGSASNVGFWAGPDFDSGIYCQSPVGIDGTPAGVNALSISPASPTVASTFVDITATSGGLTDLNMTGLSINLTGHAADAGTTTIYGINLGFTDAGTSASHGLHIPAGWDYGLFCSSANYFGGINYHYASVDMTDNNALSVGNSFDARFVYSTAQTPNSALLTVSADSRAIVVIETADIATDFAHALQANPTIFIHSSDATDIGEFLGLSYLGLQAGAMATDKAVFDLTINAVDAKSGAAANKDGGNVVLVGGAPAVGGTPGNVQITPSDPTLSYNAVDLSLTSGTADGATAVLNGLAIATAGNAGDTNSLPIRGINLSHTAGGGSELSTAIWVDPGYAGGLILDSDPPLGLATIAGCNAASVSNTLLYLGEGTVAGIGTTTKNRVNIFTDGVTAINIDNASSGYSITQDDTGGGTALILSLTDGDSSLQRLTVLQNGKTTVGANVSDSALFVAQAATGENVFELATGVIGSTTSRMVINENGAITHTPADVTGDISIYGMSVTSGVLDNETFYGINHSITTNAGDLNNSRFIGAKFALTDAGGSCTTTGLQLTGGWNLGAQIDTDPDNANEYSVAVCNANSNASNLLYLGEGTVAQIGGTNSPRVTVTCAGVTTISATSNTSPALVVQQSGTNYVAYFDNGTNLRMSMTASGLTTLSSETDLGSELLSLDQNDEDQAFVDFQGTFAADTSKNLSTFTGGAGAVVGPAGQSVAEAYWAFAGMIKIEANGAEGWVPYYTYQAS